MDERSEAFGYSLTPPSNLRCIYCHREGETREMNNEMSVETISNIVKLPMLLELTK